jgi:ribulose 1,5-bisphosphate synthetase/thiazole synthase
MMLVRRSKNLIRFFSTASSLPRETMEYDVLIVGGGVAGLSAAIKIKQLE